MISVWQAVIALMLCVVCSSCSSVPDSAALETAKLHELNQAENANDKALVQKANYSLARFYNQEGDYEKAIPYYLKFLESKREEPVNTYHGLAWNLAELANLYFHAGQYPMAVPIYQEAIRRMYEYDRYADVIGVLDQLAVCSWKNNDTTVAQLKFSEAQTNYNKSVNLPALKQQKGLLNAQYALMLDHWADMSAALGKKADSEKLGSTAAALWQALRQETRLPANAGKQEIVEALAEHYCRLGKPFQAETLLDVLLELPTTSRSQLADKVRKLQQECLSTNAERSNPYLEKFNSLKSRQDCFDNRQILCQKYAWAVPNEEAINVLLAQQPLIEVGAGTGYWASLVRKKGGQIIAADVLPAPSKGNHWHALAGSSWTEVLSGDETIVRQYPNRTLFLSFPPEINRCAYNALKLYKGNVLIYVGEDAGGCTGTKEFHDALAREWHLVKQVEIPQWPGVYDMLYVYARNKPESINKSAADAIEKVLGASLARTAEKSPTASGDLADLLRLGIKVEFVAGRQRAFFDSKTKTIYISKNRTDSQKLQAISHEYSHVALNPTLNPIAGKTGREEFIRQGLEQEADAVIHELMVANELKSVGIILDRSTATLLNDYQAGGRQAVYRYILESKNSATNENYIDHFDKWYAEVVPPSAARP